MNGTSPRRSHFSQLVVQKLLAYQADDQPVDSGQVLYEVLELIARHHTQLLHEVYELLLTRFPQD